MENIKARLEYLRQELRAERISIGELLELQGYASHIEDGDVELLEAAGVPEFAMKNSEKNLQVLQNFILHVTHSNIEGTDKNFNEFCMVTPEQLYQHAVDYIEEDHVDGKENPDD